MLMINYHNIAAVQSLSALKHVFEYCWQRPRGSGQKPFSRLRVPCLPEAAFGGEHPLVPAPQAEQTLHPISQSSAIG